MKAINKADQISSGLLIAGALSSALMGLTKDDRSKKQSGNRSSGMKIYYGLLGAATAYKIGRVLAPKTKEEKSLIKIAEMYDRAEDYRKKARKYRKTANVSFNQSVKQLDNYFKNKKMMHKS